MIIITIIIFTRYSFTGLDFVTKCTLILTSKLIRKLIIILVSFYGVALNKYLPSTNGFSAVVMNQKVEERQIAY